MKVTVLGCQGPFPGPGGATSGYLVEAGETRICLDLGSGCLAALTALTPPESLTALVFSHWHHDHCADALPLIYRLQAKQAVLDVWGPVDDASPVRAALAGVQCVRLHTLSPGDRVNLGTVELQAHAARHPVPALALRLEAAGKTLCYTGDTNTLEHLDAFAREADLLLADGLFPAASWSQDKPHLSAALAAELARDARAARLVITHLHPEIDPAVLLREAGAIRPDAELASPGAVWTL
ncbi:MAG: MBL fold metallo-hydrolase [Clostridia bacterium]|nr:MBL fold metallo-hydrolase [Clostridia bacterium]